MLVSGAGLALGGCAGMAGLITKSPATAYDLPAATAFPRRAAAARGQLVVAEPTALAPLDGEAILVRPQPGEAAQLAGAQWQDRLPRLVQARLVESFENAHRLRAVGRPADRITADYALLTDLRAFEISAADNSAVVEVAVKLVRQSTGRIVAAHVFRASVPLAETEGAGAVAALDQAFVKAATDVVLWAERRV